MSTHTMDKITRIRQVRSGGMVERCHGIPHQSSYSNAAHQWGVAMLLWELWPEHFERLVIYALGHDVPETIVGDIPAPTMRYARGVRDVMAPIEQAISHEWGLPSEHDLSPEDHARLKACDRLELYLWACEETFLRGNHYATECRNELERYFHEQPLPEPAHSVYCVVRADPFGLLPLQAGVMKALASRGELT